VLSFEDGGAPTFVCSGRSWWDIPGTLSSIGADAQSMFSPTKSWFALRQPWGSCVLQGEARLSLITNEKGGILDDTIITNAGDYL
jgi:hypothetical protein